MKRFKNENEINYAELYGVFENEPDFYGAIIRAKNKEVQHLSKEFIDTILNFRNKYNN